MKLLFSTIVTVALLFSTEKNELIKKEESTIAHFTPATEASFSYASPYYLDIDNDGIKDFSFQTVSYGENGNVKSKYLVHPMNGNQVMHVEQSAAIAEAGEVISDELPRGNVHWSADYAEIIESTFTGEATSWFGTWSGERDQYLGIKLVKDGKTYLGWVRVQVNPQDEKAYVKEYAINRRAGEQLVTSL